jgi:glutathione synthase
MLDRANALAFMQASQPRVAIESKLRTQLMSIALGIVMDPIGSINVKKDSSLAMLLAAQARGWQLFYTELPDLLLRDGQGYGFARRLQVRDDANDWFTFIEEEALTPLKAFDVILMRKDPPFDMEYVYATYVLERAEALGVLVVNRPQGLRDVNEKLYTAWFSQCCAPTLVTRRQNELHEFLRSQEDVIIKPLDRMGGASVFRVRLGDPNTNVIFETMTDYEQRFIMAQRFIPEISAGDKRILLIDGQPVPYALARVPVAGETRGNLAAGGQGVGVPLDAQDRWICSQVGPVLRDKGLLMVGLDVIGEYLTEINVTSPTCIRELDRIYSLDIAGQLMDAIEARLDAKAGARAGDRF